MIADVSASIEDDDLDGILSDPSTWTAPPADLRSRLLAAAEAERPVVDPIDRPIDDSPVSVSASVSPLASVLALSPRRRPSRRLAAAAVAGGIAAGAIIGIGAMQLLADDRGHRFELDGGELAADMTAGVYVSEVGSGLGIELDVDGLAPAATDEYYAAWLGGTDGMVPIGTFHLREGDDLVELWSGVALQDFPNLVITRQAVGQPPLPSEELLRGSLIEERAVNGE